MDYLTLPYGEYRNLLFFLSRVLVDDGCWLWIGAKTKGGYGTMRLGGSYKPPTLVTRYVLELFGVPRSEGKPWILHNCNNSSCVRPSHLFWGTPGFNVQLSYYQGRRSQEAIDRATTAMSKARWLKDNA